MNTSNEFNPDWNQVEALQEALREHMAEIQRLRKREWVSLTENEFELILEKHNEAFPYDVYKSIDAELKEKNT